MACLLTWRPSIHSWRLPNYTIAAEPRIRSHATGAHLPCIPRADGGGCMSSCRHASERDPTQGHEVTKHRFLGCWECRPKVGQIGATSVDIVPNWPIPNHMWRELRTNLGGHHPGSTPGHSWPNANPSRPRFDRSHLEVKPQPAQIKFGQIWGGFARDRPNSGWVRPTPTRNRPNSRRARPIVNKFGHDWAGDFVAAPPTHPPPRVPPGVRDGCGGVRDGCQSDISMFKASFGQIWLLALLLKSRFPESQHVFTCSRPTRGGITITQLRHGRAGAAGPFI